LFGCDTGRRIASHYNMRNYLPTGTLGLVYLRQPLDYLRLSLPYYVSLSWLAYFRTYSHLGAQPWRHPLKRREGRKRCLGPAWSTTDLLVSVRSRYVGLLSYLLGAEDSRSHPLTRTETFAKSPLGHRFLRVTRMPSAWPRFLTEIYCLVQVWSHQHITC